MSALYPHTPFDDAEQLHVRAADPDLAISPFDGLWWRTTKRMIERGSVRFWARRGFAPAAHDFNTLQPATMTTPTTDMSTPVHTTPTTTPTPTTP